MSHHDGGKKKNHVKEHMLDYIISLFDDANDFSWDVPTASHAILLCRMEQGEISDYTQVEKVDRVCRANSQRHTVPSSGSQNSKKLSQKSIT